MMNDFLNFLQERIDQVKATEDKALHLLHTIGDQEGYQENMRLKAQILSNLSEHARPFLDAVPLTHRPSIEHRLDVFSQSAQRSLDLDSVFYMSALLYPEEHQPGEPNTLELWLRDLKRLK